jgi:glutamate--cysteine ligase
MRDFRDDANPIARRHPMADSKPRILERLNALPADRLAGIRRGVEKESLRVGRTGSLASTPHPAALGSALTHPCITTDFSESQIELITGVHDSAESCLGELTRIHQFVCRELADEMLWVASMPCRLPPDDAIPIARYGSSNIGRAKSVYRRGIAHRYGRRMQTISGIHYNWSMPGIDTPGYFALIRNFRRHVFLPIYLFGASPAVDASFVAGHAHRLQPLGEGSYGRPHATSLRMGRLGYQSDAQAALTVSYNCLESYAASLHQAMVVPYPDYEAIGLRDADGEYRQLSTTLLQIENEFYGTIRPKRVIRKGERPLHALRERGVEYIEVRCMDLDPFVTIGIEPATVRFLDMFLLHCLLSDSPPDSPAESAALARNQEAVTSRGREPGLRLERHGREVLLVEWGEQLLDELGPIAAMLDAGSGGTAHQASLDDAHSRLNEPRQLPSARVLAAMSSEFGGSHVDFVRARSEAALEALLGQPWSASDDAHFRRLAEASRREQASLEASDELSFESFREQYLSPLQLLP